MKHSLINFFTIKTMLSFTIAAVMAISVYGQGKEKKEKDKFLANKVFTVELTETGLKKPAKPVQDEITFKSDKLNSKFMSTENEFKAAPYTLTVDSSSSEKIITFEATGKNPSDEEIKWNGTVTGEALEGAVQISKKGKVKKEYSFTGTLKIKKK